jgi:hypothetical protein
MDDQGSIRGRDGGKDFFFFFLGSYRLWGNFPGVKRSSCEVGYSPASTAEVENA